MVSRKLKTINKLAREIAADIDGLLDGEEPEKRIFRRAIKIVNLSERKSFLKKRKS